jgi:hypothetical protein
VTRIDSLALFQSETRAGGAVYTPLLQLALGGG